LPALNQRGCHDLRKLVMQEVAAGMTGESTDRSYGQCRWNFDPRPELCSCAGGELSARES
jgi:hypothetical protein